MLLVNNLLSKLLEIFWFIFTWNFMICSGARHACEIIQSPNDITQTECGTNVRMTCIAKPNDRDTLTPPDTEWWYRSPGSATGSSKRLFELDREGRVFIKIEEFVVVRSTLVLKDVQSDDEGVYQCRASKSPHKYEARANMYQHWKIEEAIVADLKCGQDTSTTPTVHMFPSAVNNQTRVDEVIATTISSLKIASRSTPFKDTKEKKPLKGKATPPCGFHSSGIKMKRQPKRSTYHATTTSQNGSDSRVQRNHRLLPWNIINCLLFYIFFLT